VNVKGPLGTLEQQVPVRMEIVQEDGVLNVTRPTDRGDDRALHGLTRTLVANMVEGRHEGLREAPRDPGRRLPGRSQGQRPRAGRRLLAHGHDHAADGVSFEVPVPTQIVVKGTDKQVVGQTAAEIRKVRPPEPYKGKGIRYRDEQVRRKVGKRA
jgi:large subunit ribosomal protein L6